MFVAIDRETSGLRPRQDAYVHPVPQYTSGFHESMCGGAQRARRRTHRSGEGQSLPHRGAPAHAHEPSVIPEAVRQHHLDLGGAVGHVMVGEDMALCIHEYPGPELHALARDLLGQTRDVEERVQQGIALQGQDARFLSICRWLQLIYKDWLAPLKNAPFSTLWARKRYRVAQRFRQYLRATNCYQLSDAGILSASATPVNTA